MNNVNYQKIIKNLIIKTILYYIKFNKFNYKLLFDIIKYYLKLF